MHMNYTSLYNDCDLNLARISINNEVYTVFKISLNMCLL